MRNLKRVLSLALSAAMLMGMMVMGAGAADKKTAADLTDSDKIVNKEAVTLLVDLGVIEGKTDGSYSPTEVVNRATMAKLITMMLVGNVDQNSYKGTATDLKDVDGHWAEGYIKYCYSNKIITGDGAGHFFPDQPVTVVQAAKMILVALGYDADHSKYQNDANWSNNIMRDATTTKMTDAANKSTVRSLIKGASVKASDSLTRDNAAQMIFNGLFVDTVEPKYEWDMGVQRINGYDGKSSLAATIYGGLARKTGLLTVAGDKTSTIDGKSVKIASTSSDIGANVVYYVDDSAKVISSAAVSAATEVLGTSMNGTAYSKLIDNTDKKNFIAAEDGTKVTYIVNGDTSKNKSDVETASKKAGVIVDLIDNDGDGDIDVVKVVEKDIYVLSDNVATRTYKDEAQVSVPGVFSGYKAVSKVSGYEDLKKDDEVLVYTTGTGSDQAWYIEKADTITGKISGQKSTGEIRVDGAYYGWSGLDNAADITDVQSSGKLDTANEYRFALDNAGNIANVKKITDESTGDIAVVLDTAEVKGGGIGKTDYLEVKLLLADGTTEVGTVAKVLDKDGKTVVEGKAVKASNVPNYDFFTYTLDKNDNYVLKAVSSALVDTLGATTIKNGKTGVEDYTANAKTLFLVEKGDKAKTYFTYTGYGEVPSMTIAASTASKVVLDKAGSKLAKYVFLTTEAFTGDIEKVEYVYIIDPASYSYVAKEGDVPAHYDYSVIMNGEKTTLSVNDTLASASISAAGLYNVKELVDGIAVVTKIEAVAAGDIVTYDKDRDSIGDGVVILNAKTYTYDGDTAVYMISVTADDTDVTVTTGDRVKFSDPDLYTYKVVVSPVEKDGQLLASIYVIQTEKS